MTLAEVVSRHAEPQSYVSGAEYGRSAPCLTVQHVRSLIDKLTAQGHSPSLVRRCLKVVPASPARPVALRGCSRRLLLPLLFRVEQLGRAARLDVEVQVVARDAHDDLVAGLHAPAQHQP